MVLRWTADIETFFSIETQISENPPKLLKKESLIWKTVNQQCQIIKSFTSRIILQESKGEDLSQEEEVDKNQRFFLLDLIREMWENKNENRRILTDTNFLYIKFRVENFLSERNPYLLTLIKSPGTFRQKLWKLNFLLEYYSFETSEHTEEVWLIAERIAKGLNEELGYDIDLECFKEFRQFHDLGKLLVPPEVLMKPWKLTDEEFYIIKRHPIYSSILIKILLFYSEDYEEEDIKEYANRLIQIALYHHITKDDGYPSECSHLNLTVETEIVRLADIYQALSSKRCYKASFWKEDVLDILSKLENTFKDPNVLRIFYKYSQELDDIMEERKSVPENFLSVWNKLIDEWQKRIERKIREIFESDEESVLSKFEELIEVTERKFEEEETLMKQTWYPLYEKHLNFHEDMLQRLKNVLFYDIKEINKEFLKKFIIIWFKRAYHFHSKTLDQDFSNWEQNIDGTL